MLGWDIDSRVQLNPGTADPPLTLLPFLNDVLARRPTLRVYALAWDFSVMFTLEREPLPTYRFAWNAHPRLAFRLDDAHPFGGAHHQKIVVVDDALAFAGGLDLTIRRWDTPAHQANEPARVDPAGVPYPPAHDMQMMVDGEAAAALGELARARWQAATGEAPAAPRSRAEPAADLWPETTLPDVRGRADWHRPHDAAVSRRAGGEGDRHVCGAVDRLGAPLHLHREPVPDVGGHRRGAGAPAGRARRARGRHRAPPRGARLAGAELDGRHARARCCGACSAPTVTAGCACSSRKSPPWTRAAA